MAKQITPRSQDYSKWYHDIVLKAGLADYAPVKGCMIIKPYGYAIWEKMQRYLDDRFKETGHQNAYFPLFIPESFMKKEAEHVEGFAPECAVVTHGGGKKLEEPLMIRPTSETIIWDTYRKWIQSYRDLPLLINQWANVVRWEMRTRLFLRTTEFLWQEGHTAHASEEDARKETMMILEIYRQFAEDIMAVPVIPGLKSENEKFAGAVDTYSIEAMMQDGDALQAGTSHYLGQNFAKAFDVKFQDENSELNYVYATSWGVSTRLIGALVMAHSDDQGLIMPPKLAPIEVVIVPIYRDEDSRSRVLEVANRLVAEYPNKLSIKLDDRDEVRPGWKFNEWEMKGVPLRIEIGPRDVDAGKVTAARRDTGEKRDLPIESAVTQALALLDEIQQGIYDKAHAFRKENTHRIDKWDDFKEFFKNGSGFVEAHWNGKTESELEIQNQTKATVRNIPLSAEEEDGKCILTGEPSSKRVIFSKSY
ncbi:MAG: proline--tRNA ligase [Planctomycetota bacterium]|nr:proline--tRNA ligase [Planctomycetota bacterium]MDA1139082.1 proline--tRNA ligase [Planctomycetota bacterium]